ncbi:chemotaxis protein CheC [Methanocalculus alkaliphilus]|uniref:chemotaxis protein CheC n=1 Tax=Methanocalculus alkaliphilus TaxID=768730 RepID=UPI0020A00F0D|nr:chemotaxis protein CheC [Methanocalculus alkaliphilus]MCP1715150.1 chemotaxis protein CheC [Methanocalculus alkaliphilus]
MTVLTPAQLDALSELGNIGASHAATSLSQMLMGEIEMTVPSVEIVDLADIYKHVTDEVSALAIFEMQGEIEKAGYVIFLMPLHSAIRMTNTMLGMADEDREINEMDESALNEIGNIMVSAFLDATAELLGVVMLPSPPVLVIDMGHAAIQQLLVEVACDVNEVVFFHTKLVCDQYAINGDLLMLPEIHTLSQILEMMDKLLNAHS